MPGGYEDIAQEYEGLFLSLPYRTHIEQWSVLHALGDVGGRSVLDLGCGTGHYSRVARKRGASRVVGVDIEPRMIECAIEIEAQDKLGIDYLEGDIATLDLGITFDLVLALYLLHYAPSRKRLAMMANAIAAHLRPGGRLLSFQVNPDISRDPLYYELYGIRNNFPLHPNGTPVELTDGLALSFNAWTGPKERWSGDLDVYYWSKQAIDDALLNAGLVDVRWMRPSLSDTAPWPQSQWSAYLALPHCMLLEARKPG